MTPDPAAAPPAAPPGPLRFLGAGWFAIVMGLAGLSLAWHRAVPALGAIAGGLSLVLAAAASLVFAALSVAYAMRASRHGAAFREDFSHPVRHPFVAAMPVSVILLATAAVALGGASPVAEVAWMAGSLAQAGATTWVLARWWSGSKAGASSWPSVTPVLFIPIVGNVLVPLAGIPLGHPAWSIAQFAVGAFFWPLVAALVFARLLVQGPWPDRLLPSAFIFVAPPAVVGLALLQMGAPEAMGWGAWGIAAFSLLHAATLLKRIVALPFALPHWALSFPVAAFAALTLRLAPAGGGFERVGVMVLAVASLVIAVLVLMTVRGLRNGTLLAPEPVAVLQPG